MSFFLKFQKKINNKNFLKIILKKSLKKFNKSILVIHNLNKILFSKLYITQPLF